MQISRAIALQTLAVCAGLVLVLDVTIYSWSRYEHAQDDAGRNALALQDFRLLKETTKSWLLNNDLIFASDQNFLIMSTRRQGELVMDVAKGLLESSLGASATAPLTSIIELVEYNNSALSERQYISAANDDAGSLEQWDQRSTYVSNSLELAREQLAKEAGRREATLTAERNSLLWLCAMAYAAFVLLIVGLWHWLTRYLAKPLSDLTALADAALRTEASLDLHINGPEEVRQLTQSINAFTQLREQRENQRAKELGNQKRVLENEVHKRIEAERQAKDSARAALEASKAKSQFLANMSHEIRTPLNGIIGSAEILALDPSPEKTAWGLQNIQKSGEHLLALISQILDFSKIEAGQLELDPHPFVLDDLLAELRSIFAARAMDRGIELLFDIAPDVPLHLEGDSLRIRQVLTNLLGNAFTYTDTGFVLLRCDSVGGLQPGKRTLIWEVADTGRGIPLEQQEHIFDSFRQADAGTTRAHGGTGLGLTISKQLVELMGGRVELESQPGKGSTFRCTIDVVAHPELVEFKAVRTGDALLLINNPNLRRSLQRLLKYWGWSVASASGAHIVDGLLKPGTTLFVDNLRLEDNSLALSAARDCAIDRVIFDDSSTAYCETHPGAELKERALGTALIPGELFNVLQSMHRRQPAEEEKSGKPAALIGHVLLVEDNPVNQAVTQQMLSLMGLSVSIAEDGEVALDMAREESHDLILMDWHMPRMDGLTATRKIREHEKSGSLRRTPIIMFTADAQKENEQICRQAGANELLPKPVRLDALREILSELL